METSGVLDVKIRTLTGGSTAKQLRRSGYLPASICSKEVGSVSVSLKKDALTRIISKRGRSTVFTLKADDGVTYSAMLKDIQLSPVVGDYLNVIFQQVSLSEETKVDVPLRFEGRDSLDMRRLTMLQQIDVLEVRGLPNDIPNSIDIDLSNMEANDKVFVKDLNLGKGLATDVDPEQLVLSIIDPRSQIAETSDDEEAADTAAPDSAKSEESDS